MNRIHAIATKENRIIVKVRKDFALKKPEHFHLLEDGKEVSVLTLSGETDSSSSKIYNFKPKSGLLYEPGRDYEVQTDDNFFVPLDISFLGRTEAFEKQYRYDGELGAIYTKGRTTFVLFAPFATKVVLLVTLPVKKTRAYIMVRDRKTGVFSFPCNGNLDKASYQYMVTVFGETWTITDPYAYALAANARLSYVIDPEKVRSIPTNEEFLPPYAGKKEAIIYETHVRDMTSLTALPDKGTFNALSRKGIQTKNGLPIGLDYLASLGVSHIQIMPLSDFQTVDECHPEESYNWGYDPSYYFAPEGSFASDPEDPYSRVLELKNMVSAFHREGLRVVMDVVYNHLFSSEANPLVFLLPNYALRENEDGSLSNGTGCGNDIESRNYMIRKLIIDSLSHFLDFYDVDGYRFDLMGIIDIATLNQASELLKKKKPSIILYGEGWDLWTALPFDEKGSIPNANKLPDYSFFNDRFRDVVKGKTNSSELSVRGYLLGDTNYRDGFKHVMLGSSLGLAFPPLFDTPDQSLNYVECHDNNTLYDKIKASCPWDKEEEIHERIRMINAATVFACGIPFFHAGQEFGDTKYGEGNSYRSGDRINGMDYARRDCFKEDVAFFKEAIAMRKKLISLCPDEYPCLQKKVSFDDLEEGAVKINYTLKDFEIYLFFNPSKKTFVYTFKDYVSLWLNNTGNVEDQNIYSQMAIINGLSLNLFCARKKEEQIPEDKKTL